MLENIFPIFSFSNKLWFCPDIFSRFLFGQPLPIFAVLNFSKKSPFQKCLLFFHPWLNASLIPSSAKAPRWKVSGRFLILRIKSRSTMIVKVSDKISIDFWEKKMDLFDRTSNDAGSLLEKTDILPFWSTAAGDEEVWWLQKTNLHFHTSRILFWRNLRPFLFL